MHEPKGHGQEEPGGGLALSKADARDKDSNSFGGPSAQSFLEAARFATGNCDRNSAKGWQVHIQEIQG